MEEIGNVIYGRKEKKMLREKRYCAIQHGSHITGN